MSDTHTAKKPNETTSEEMAAAVSRVETIPKSGHSGKTIEYVFTGEGGKGMDGLYEGLRYLDAVEAAEPEQEARKATAVYARFFLERAKPPACVTGAHEEERRWRFINFETKFTDGHAVSEGGEGGECGQFY